MKCSENKFKRNVLLNIAKEKGKKIGFFIYLFYSIFLGSDFTYKFKMPLDFTVRNILFYLLKCTFEDLFLIRLF